MKFKNIPSDLTIYKSIKKLKPACMLEIDLSKQIAELQPKVLKWWSYEKLIKKA